MKRTGTLLLALFLGVCFASQCEATVYHSDGSAASVQSIHDNQAQNGDTITLPAGIFTWTTGVTISKGITLQGAGIGLTILRDAMTTGASTLRFNLATGGATRLTGIEMTDGGRTANPGATGVLQVQGSNSPGTTFRWDHCRWNQLDGVASLDTVVGVIDHVDFVFGARSNNAMFLWDTRWGGGEYGDGSWSAPTGFGTAQMGLFIEDCTVTSTLAGYVTGFTDGYNGARFVVRHCAFTGNVIVQNHGTESSGRNRGTRAMEVYNNTISGTGISSVVGGSRSGTVLFHDNTIIGSLNPPVFNLSNFRTHSPFTPWGGADGTNAWDVNDPNTFFSTTATADNSGTSVTVSGVNWMPDQWVGYSLRRLTNNCSGSSLNFRLILSNTSNTIYYTASGYEPSMTICVGDTLQIRRVIHCLDGIGRAGGSLLSSVTNPPLPAGWNDQATEPCYSWNNLQGVTPANFAVTDSSVRAGEHFFNDTPMPGYTPYVYPHPLVSGNPTPTATPAPTPTATPAPTPSATPTPTPIGTATPHPVGSFVATAVSCTETDLSWSYCCLDLANGGFDIERGTDNIHFTQINQVGFWERSYQDTTAPSGLNYYRIRAFNDNGVGDYSFASATQPSCQSPTPTATPTPCLAIVPDFVGQKLLNAQTIWESAGFTTEVITDGPPGQSIIWQSLPPGYQGDCSTTVIFVIAQPDIY